MTAARRKRQAQVWVPDLVATWRREAELLRGHGALEAAATKERDADQLQEWLGSYSDAALSLPDAARESGYSVSQLRRLVSLQVIESVGENGHIALRRRDLPRKPGRVAGPDLDAEVLGLRS